MSRTKISKSKRQKVLEKYNHKCTDCGAIGLLNVHHLNSIKDKGVNDLDNLILVCKVCHILRHGGRPNKLIKHPYWIECRNRRD